MYIPEHLFSLGHLLYYYSVRKNKISLRLKRVHYTPLLRQNENFEYCQQDLKKYVYPLMTPLENLLRNSTVLYFLSLPFSFTSPCARSSPCLAWAQWLALEIILSLQMTSPHRWPMRQNHTTEDELVIPWTMVLVGVPLMALKMWMEFGKTLVFSSSGQILRHRNTTLPKCHAPDDVSQRQRLFPNGHCSPEWWYAQGAWLWPFAEGLCQLN